ncbi:MAG: glycoside hydrolase family 18 protein [Janthinobacterium lividum]
MSFLRTFFAAPLVFSALTVLNAQATHNQPAGVKGAEPAPQIVGYFPQWGVYERRYVPVDLIRSGAMQTLTQIDYAQGNIKDNACIVADPTADLNITFKAEDSIDGIADTPSSPFRGNFHQLQLLRKRYPKLRILISLEGKRELFEQAARPENRVAFVHSCVARFLQGHIAPGVEAKVFDGIDVDWEYPDAAHAADFYGLMEEFRRQMDAPDKPEQRRVSAANARYTLSIASGASHKAIDPIDWVRVAKSVDQIGVMTYDFQGPWSHDTGFVAPLRSNDPQAETVASVIDAYLAVGVPARQLLLGLPFYAYQWHKVAPGAHNGLYSKGDPVHDNLNQATATALLNSSPDAKLYRDPASKAPWIYDGDNFLTFEDTASLDAKRTFGAQRHLGGMMIWELSGDTTDSQLLRALRTADKK